MSKTLHLLKTLKDEKHQPILQNSADKDEKSSPISKLSATLNKRHGKTINN